jgi:hypothetical protein
MASSRRAPVFRQAPGCLLPDSFDLRKLTCPECHLPDGRPTVPVMKPDIKQLTSGEVGES